MAFRLAWGERKRKGRLVGCEGKGCFFADGSLIPVWMVRVIRDTLWTLSTPVRLYRGDILFLDNHLKGHGRAPFQGGPRRLHVALVR